MKIIVASNFLFFTAVTSCSSSPRKRDEEIQRTEEDPLGFYTTNDASIRDCSIYRQESPRYKLAGINQQGNCNNLPPGVLSLQHGFTQEFITSLQVKKRLREVAFFFSCDNDTSQLWKGYTKPTEVKYLTPISRTSYDQRVLTKMNLLETFNRDVRLSEKESGFVFFLPPLRLNLSNTIASAAYLSVQFEVYEVALQNLKPSKQMRLMYSYLPIPHQSNYLPYYHFVNNYGTDIITSTVFGGRFKVLATSDRLKKEILGTDVKDKVSMEALMNQMINMDEDSFSQVTMLVEGGRFPASTNRKDIANWQDLVMKEPVLISPTLLPMHQFLEPVTNSQQKEGVEEMINFETQNQDLKKVLYELQVLRTKHTLSDFLIEKLHEEITMVCPSKSFVNTIRHGIIDTKNIGLAKFFVTCTHGRSYSPKARQDVILTRSYQLLPGICFTLKEEISSCVKATMLLPPGISCLNLFRKTSCGGSNSTVGTNSELKNTLNSDIKSFMFCPN